MSPAGLPVPAVFITAEQVRKGKPDPEGYLAGATRLGLSGPACLVFEDAPPGVAAAKAAGMQVIAVLTTHDPAALSTADIQVADLSEVILESTPDGLLTVRIR